MIKEKGTNSHHNTRFHTFKGAGRDLLYEVETGKMIEVESALLETIQGALSSGDVPRAEMMATLAGIKHINKPEAVVPKTASVHAFSLAIAQKCNLGCTYCYAEQGTFGGKPSNMELDIAKQSVDTLLTEAEKGGNITLAFMGGEPLFNRSTLHDVTKYAAQKAVSSNVGISFAITTNGTLIREEDIDLFQEYKFTVTLSIDGLEDDNNALRPYISGKGSFDKVKKNVQLLVEHPNRQFMLLARITVTPKNLNLEKTMKGLFDMGFDSIKFSPMLKSPTGKEEMNTADFDALLEQMTACGEYFKAGLEKGDFYPVSNIISTLKRIHIFHREQYPCGAGGGYMGVSAEGDLYACHRFVNDDDGHLGDVKTGVDHDKQEVWLKDRHLSAQGACTTCWARYMCSGSCHHEVIKRGRPACDYIRGWLHYCLGLYADLLISNPEKLNGILVDYQSDDLSEEML